MLPLPGGEWLKLEENLALDAYLPRPILGESETQTAINFTLLWTEDLGQSLEIRELKINEALHIQIDTWGPTSEEMCIYVAGSLCFIVSY